MKRGDIYYIQRHDTVGMEIMKARPGVIVSRDRLNATSEVVEVVYLTTQPKKEMPTHVAIQSTGRPSTALCEHIDYVSIMLVGDYCGRCTDEEMAAIDTALMCSLNLPMMQAVEENTEPDAVNHPSHYNSGKIEVIDFIEDQGLGFNLGNVVKYTARAGKKDPTKTLEDLKKAAFYLDREIKRLREEALTWAPSNER